ncbi:hypothetical protein PHMEG_00034812 [Phytophthora megakarya]|uniref:Uncharacterized protein n=1 Tax=Phytophthora megakarya TaxID=4795 RepID=A0A225URP1_9STRA|nr:hypothetical protein PHMEG_00034812 [Phytophthora megakarya]
MTSRDCRRVVRVTRQSTLSLLKLKTQLELIVSTRYVRRFLTSTELFKYVKINKAPKLTAAHHQARVERAEAHHD